MEITHKKYFFILSIFFAFIFLVQTVQAGPLFKFVSDFISQNTISSFYNTYQTWVDFIIYMVIFIALILGVFKNRFGKSTKIIGVAMGVALSIALVNFLPGLIGRLGPIAFLIFVALFFYLIFSSLKEGFESKLLAMALAYVLSFIVLWILDPQGKLKSFLGRITFLDWLKDLLILLFVIALFIIGFTLLYFAIKGILKGRGENRQTNEPPQRRPPGGRGVNWSDLPGIRHIRNLLGRAEQETEQDVAGIRETESALEDIPTLLNRLPEASRRDRGRITRQIIEIFQNAGVRERRNYEELVTRLEEPLSFIRTFAEETRRSNILEQFQQISQGEDFNNYPEETRNEVLELIRDLSTILNEIEEIDNFFLDRLGRRTGFFRRLIQDLENIPPQVEQSLSEEDHGRVEDLTQQTQEILENMITTLQEIQGRLRELGDLENRTRQLQERISQ